MGRSDAHGIIRLPSETERGLKGTSFRFALMLFYRLMYEKNVFNTIFSLPSVVALWYDYTIYCGNCILEDLQWTREKNIIKKLQNPKPRNTLEKRKPIGRRKKKRLSKLLKISGLISGNSLFLLWRAPKPGCSVWRSMYINCASILFAILFYQRLPL